MYLHFTPSMLKCSKCTKLIICIYLHNLSSSQSTESCLIKSCSVCVIVFKSKQLLKMKFKMHWDKFIVFTVKRQWPANYLPNTFLPWISFWSMIVCSQSQPAGCHTLIECCPHCWTEQLAERAYRAPLSSGSVPREHLHLHSQIGAKD